MDLADLVLAERIRRSFPVKRSANAKLRTRTAAKFLFLGALLVAADRGFLRSATDDGPDRRVIEISAERVASLRAGSIARTGEAPQRTGMLRMLAVEIDDEILLREARARGLEVSDPVVRVRLARNVGFLEGDDESNASPGAADRVAAALELGLEKSDLVVRRRAIERMRAELMADAATAPSEAEIEARFARDRASLAGSARVRVSHVFLGGVRGDRELEDSALRLRAQIGVEGLDRDAAIARGDAFLLGHTLSSRTQAELGREVGAEFARAVFAQSPGSWSQPIASSYGLHLVFVHERSAAPAATASATRASIVAELVREREAVALRQALDALRGRYEIRVAGEGG